LKFYQCVWTKNSDGNSKLEWFFGCGNSSIARKKPYLHIIVEIWPFMFVTKKKTSISNEFLILTHVINQIRKGLIFSSHIILEFSNRKSCKLTSSSKYSFLIGQVPTDSSREHCLWKPDETWWNWTKEKMTVLIGKKPLTHKNILCIYTNSWSYRIQ
jgi:hypothetical protein